MDKTECPEEIPCFDLESCSYFRFHGCQFRPGEVLHVWLKPIPDPKPGMAPLMLVLDHVSRKGERVELGQWDVNAHADAMEEPLDIRQAVLNVLMRHHAEDPYDKSGAWFDPARFRLRRMLNFDVDNEYLRFSLQLRADTQYDFAEIFADDGNALEAQEHFQTARWLESLKPFPSRTGSADYLAVTPAPPLTPAEEAARIARSEEWKRKKTLADLKRAGIDPAQLKGEHWQWADVTLLRFDGETGEVVIVQHKGEVMRFLREGAPRAFTPPLWSLLLQIIGNKRYIVPLGPNGKPQRALSNTERSNSTRLSKALAGAIPGTGRAIEGNAAHFAVEENPLRKVEEMARLAQASLDDSRRPDRIEKPIA